MVPRKSGYPNSDWHAPVVRIRGETLDVMSKQMQRGTLPHPEAPGAPSPSNFSAAPFWISTPTSTGCLGNFFKLWGILNHILLTWNDSEAYCCVASVC